MSTDFEGGTWTKSQEIANVSSGDGPLAAQQGHAADGAKAAPRLSARIVGRTKMKVENAARELERHFAQRGEVESALTPAAAVASMIAFYRDVRAEECDLKADGDMLLFQWGTYDWGDGPRFEFDLTRQFIVGAGDDDDIRQLHLTFRFKSDDSLRSLAAGDRWCRTPQELADFLSFIEGHPAYHAVGSRTDGEKELLFEGV